MKLTKVYGIIALAAMVAIPSLTSCSKDDDGPDGGSGSGTGSGGQYAGEAILDVDGKKLTQLRNYSFTYDSEGRLLSVREYNDGPEIEINYSNNTITIDDETGAVSFNAEGLITQLSQSWEDSGDGWTEKGGGTLTFNYNNGYLSSYSTNGQWSETDEDGTETGTYSSSTNFTWQNNVLVSASGTATETEDGYTYNYKDSYSVTSSDDPNKFSQVPYYMSEIIIGDEELTLLAVVGLLGKGPAYLPEVIKYTTAENNNDPYVETLNFTFTLNSNGSIDEESTEWGNISYTYGNVKSLKEYAENPQKKLKLRNLFKGNRKK